jgi:DNA-binding NtrC family response regulator
MTQRVLIVDDQADFARGLERLVQSEFPDLETATAGSGEQALERLRSDPLAADVMLTDMRMPGMGGMDLLREALAARPHLAVVMLTAYGTIETAVEAVKAGAYDFLTKPVEPDELFRVLRKALERSRLLQENVRLRGLLDRRDDPMVGEGPAMQRLRESLAAVAQSDYTVLVLGESGTGKELAARTLHAQSPRTDRPFVAVNCPAIPADLLESELFGHVKGAFTGADRDRRGLFAAAQGGTLHLDEIGDIPMATQTKLLRCLQEREVRPVGSSESVPVDVRVVASTNQDLEARIRDKSFREDLYYRLNVLTVHVPPLRERTEDVPLLARHFLAQACAEMRLPDKDVAPDVLAYLAGKEWPGNVRELQNFMRRLTVFCGGEQVSMACVRMAERGAGAPESSADAAQPYKDAKARVVDDFTRGYVGELLSAAGGNVSEAARASGLSRVALQKILAKYAIDPDRFRRS